MRRAAAVAELDSDETILNLMEYQRIMEDICDVYKAAKKSDSASLPAHVETLSACLDSWWTALPSVLQDSGEHFMNISLVNSG